MPSYLAPAAMLPSGWAEQALIQVDDAGFITAVEAGAAAGADERLAGPVIPGMPNLHSHAFQRAMAGLAERAAGGADDFWGWREVMYRFLARLNPDDVAAIAAQLYLEMARQGYTAVGEFHYLHHGPGGAPYADRAELSRRVIEAAREVGIGITHLPVLYTQGGFGGEPPLERQRRFVNDPAGLAEILATLRRDYAADPQVALGLAPHSLRAVDPPALAEALTAAAEADPSAPIHIHAAEQTREVEECRAALGAPPVAWLLEHAQPDARWCLIHATHMTAEETAGLAASGAVAGLCPTTEANLGDGLFPLPAYLEKGGAIGIGGDSHVSVNMREELRWLEYGQRLLLRARNVAASIEQPATGARLYRAALEGGRRALGRPIARIEAGSRADLLVLDGGHPALCGKAGDDLLGGLVFAASDNPVRDVMIGGRWVMREGRHPDQEAILERYGRTIRRLQA